MNVLSLFDGMSCGQIALERAGIKVDNYFASEIDKHAIKVTMANYPGTIQLGSVVDVDVKTLSLSEVYAYLCERYFNNDIHNLQSIIPEWELLHRINQEQCFAAFFGTQIQNEKSETSKHSTVSINDRIWFFKNPMDNNGGIYDIIRGGERRAKANRLDFNSMLEHSFWWNGNRQQEPTLKGEGVERINGEGAVGGNETKIEGLCEKSVSISRGKGTSKNQSKTTICQSTNETELSEWDSKDRYASKNSQEKSHRRNEKTTKVSDIKTELSTTNEDNRIEQIDANFSTIYNQVQATVVECEWGIIVFKGVIKITCGGSPCQSFSFAGKRKGMSTKDEQEILTLDHYLQLKSEGFEFEGQSYLFWEYMRILTDIRKYNPNVKFLLENVIMGEKWEKVLSRAIGINPIEINSSLVSAQNRRRLYWTNIGLKPQGLFGDLQSIIEQPKDRGILLKDILESEVDEKYYLSEKANQRLMRYQNNERFTQMEGKSITLLQAYYKHGRENQYIVCNKPRDIYQLNPSKESGGMSPYQQNRVYDIEGISPALLAKKADLLIHLPDYGNKRLNETIQKNELVEGCLIDSYNKSIHIDKSITISTRVRNSNSTHLFTNSRIRRLTPTECERLQTVKDGYTAFVSDSQRYKMLGNGWTIEVITHILSYLNK